MDKVSINADLLPSASDDEANSTLDERESAVDKSAAALENMDLGQPSEEDEINEAVADSIEAKAADPEETTEETTEEVGEELVFDSERAMLEAKGIEGFDSVEDYKASLDTDFSEMMKVMKANGYDGAPANMKEFTQDVMQMMMNTEQGAADAPPGDAQGSPPEAAPALDMKGFFTKYDHIPAEDQPFYNDLVNTIAAQIKNGDKSAEVTSRLDSHGRQSDLMLDLMWYNEAVSQAGDAPIPPFSEARRIMQTSGDARKSAVFSLMKFGTPKNPMPQAFETWRAAKTPSGASNAQAAQQAQGARKVKIQKGLLKSTPATRTKTKSFKDMDQAEREAELDKMPA